MQYTWEHTDIKVGRLVETHNRAERMIIGYDPNPPAEPASKGQALYVISLNDGQLTAGPLGRRELIDWLNNVGARPTDIHDGDVS